MSALRDCAGEGCSHVALQGRSTCGWERCLPAETAPWVAHLPFCPCEGCKDNPLDAIAREQAARGESGQVSS